MHDIIGINLNYDIILSEWDAWRHLRKFIPLKKFINSTKKGEFGAFPTTSNLTFIHSAN